jgi:hypothetical protein
MSDRFDTLFEGLRGQRPPTPFAPAAAVRKRGRQRAQRHAVSIGVAVLAVTGLGAGGVVTALGEPDTPAPPAGTTAANPPPVPSPDQPTDDAPAVTEIPDSWLLTAADLPETGWQEQNGELLEGAWFWDNAEPWCPEYRVDDYPSVGQQIDVDTGGWARAIQALPERVDQAVELYPTGVGTQNIDDVRAFVELCSRRPEPGDQVAPTAYTIVDTDFAGDESLLIWVEQYVFNENGQIVQAGEPDRVAVVRVGDAVTTIRFLNVFLYVDDAVLTIARRAADRLRE